VIAKEMKKSRDEIREKIVDSAGVVFGKQGFRKTRMEEVAHAAKMGKSSLYYYFTSKEELFEAVVAREAEQMKNEIIKSTRNIQDPYKRLKKYILVRMNSFQQSINLYNAVKSNYLGHLPFIEKVRAKYDKEELLMVENIIRDGVRNHQFKVVNTEVATIAIVTALKGLEIPLFIRGNDQETEKLIENLLLILFYGIVKRK
jgi:AcrR family transcriptional regulator